MTTNDDFRRGQELVCYTCRRASGAFRRHMYTRFYSRFYTHVYVHVYAHVHAHVGRHQERLDGTLLTDHCHALHALQSLLYIQIYQYKWQGSGFEADEEFVWRILIQITQAL